MATPNSRSRIRSNNPTRKSRCWNQPFIQNRVEWRSDRNWQRPTWCTLVQSRSNSSRVSRNWPIPTRRKSPRTLLREKEENIYHKSCPIYTNQWKPIQVRLRWISSSMFPRTWKTWHNTRGTFRSSRWSLLSRHNH